MEPKICDRLWARDATGRERRRGKDKSLLEIMMVMMIYVMWAKFLWIKKRPASMKVAEG